MGMCKDPVTQELNRLGYNLVKLPRVGIEPLDVLGRDGDSMEKLGSVAEVWTSTVPAPTAGAPAPAPNIGGGKTSDLDANAVRVLLMGSTCDVNGLLGEFMKLCEKCAYLDEEKTVRMQKDLFAKMPISDTLECMFGYIANFIFPLALPAL